MANRMKIVYFIVYIGFRFDNYTLINFILKSLETNTRPTCSLGNRRKMELELAEHLIKK